MDGLVSSRPGRDLKEGDSLAGIIGNTMLEQPLANGCYRASLQLSTNLSARCTLDAEGIHPAPDDDGRERAFVLRILPSTGDSLHILLENHTNLPVQPRFLPAIGTDELLTLPLLPTPADRPRPTTWQPMPACKAANRSGWTSLRRGSPPLCPTRACKNASPAARCLRVNTSSGCHCSSLPMPASQ